MTSLFTAKPEEAPSLTGESPLRPIVGPNSVLTAVGPRHMRQRKLLLPPFHGEAVQRYTEFYLEHMALEEREVMPLALQALTKADWNELDEALAPEPDPLTGLEPEAAYRALFDRIVFTVPPPLGLGRG